MMKKVFFLLFVFLPLQICFADASNGTSLSDLCDNGNNCACLEMRNKAIGKCYCVKTQQDGKDVVDWYVDELPEDGSETRVQKNVEYCVDLQEQFGDNHAIYGQTGVHLLGNYLSLIYKYGASIIGIISVLIIVVSGIQIMMGGADPEMVTQAKTRIFQAILSLIILFLSAAILITVNPGFFGS